MGNNEISDSDHFQCFRDDNSRNQARKYLPKLAALGITPEVIDISNDGVRSTLCLPFSVWWREADLTDLDSMYPKVVSVIQSLHGQGICHRDLHDRSLVLDKELNPLIIDFELACDVDSNVRCYNFYGPSETVPVPSRHIEVGRAFAKGVWWGCGAIDPYVSLGRIFRKFP